MKIQDLGLRDYQPTLLAMQQFTQQRDNHTEDELWLLEHYPVRIREVTFGVILSIAIIFYVFPRFLSLTP